jgi:lactoylglutathione lyase
LHGDASVDPFDRSLWVGGTTAREPRLLHTKFRVADFDAALRFYVDGLGMAVLNRFDLPDRQVTVHRLGYDPQEGGCLELVQRLGEHGPCSHGSAYGHVSIGVPDLRQVVATLEAMGTEITVQPSRLVTDGPYLSFVRDPAGHSLELLEFDPASWVGGSRESRPRFMHTMLRVFDLEAAVRFFRDGLGMKLLDRFEVSVRRATAQFLGFGGYDSWCVELVHNWDASEPYSHGTGDGHLAIGVPDVAAMVDRLAGLGVETLQRPTRVLQGGPAFACVQGPEGHTVDLLQTYRS